MAAWRPHMHGRTWHGSTVAHISALQETASRCVSTLQDMARQHGGACLCCRTQHGGACPHGRTLHGSMGADDRICKRLGGPTPTRNA
eukprot:354859-Chlamydomonas_euryale.AAC.2